MKKLIVLVVLLAVGGYDYFLGEGDLVSQFLQGQSETAQPGNSQAEATQGNVPLSSAVADNQADQLLQQAFDNRQSDVQVEGSGTVARVLSDDNDGSRHQRFILELSNGQSLLVAHNIDLAPRIESIAVGDVVQFYGEYEWNDRGGVMHWTHHDPNGRHEDGWLKHNGLTYQ